MLLLLLDALARPSLFAADEQQGVVTFNGLPVPGATIIATQSDKKIVASSDVDGRYRITGLGDGSYAILVEMLGFAPLTRDLVADEQSTALELTLLPLEELKRIAVVAANAPVAPIAPTALDAPSRAVMIAFEATACCAAASATSRSLCCSSQALHAQRQIGRAHV